MRRRPPLPAVLAIAALTGLSVLPTSVGPAMAKSRPSAKPRAALKAHASAEERQFYTRKKVNGRWVTGHFPVETGRQFASLPPAVELPHGPVPPARPFDQSPSAGGPERDLSTASISAIQDGPARTELLRAALAARAHALAASDDATLQVPAPAPPPPLVRLTPSVVTLDYRAGTRTTLFEDGAVVSERFDASAGPPALPSR